MPDPVAESHADPASRVCPECGAPQDLRPSLRRRPESFWPRWLPRLSVLAVVGLLISGGLFSQQRWGGPARTSTTWAPAAGRLTIADLGGIANGTRDGTAMVAGLRGLVNGESVVGDELVEVRLMPTTGMIYDYTSYGWPTTLALRSVQSQYEDVFTKTGPVARDWGTSWNEFWSRGTRYSGGATPTATDRRWSVYPAELALGFTFLLGGWYVGQGAGTLLRRLRNRSRNWRTILGLACAAFVGVAIAAGTLTKPVHTVTTNLGPLLTTWAAPPATMPPSISTSWKVADLRDALAADDAAPAIAARLLGLLPPRADQALVIDFGTVFSWGPSTSGMAGYPSQWFMWDEGPRAQPMRAKFGPGLRLNAYRMGELIYTRRDGNNVRMWAIMGPELSMYIIMAWLAWHLLPWLAALIIWIIERRRHTRHQCLRCGYELAGLQTPAP